MMRVARRYGWLAAGIILLDTGARGASVSVQVSDTRGGPIENAVIVLDPLDEVPPSAHESASIDQVNQQFVPRLTVIRTGTSVSFPNSDRVRHQVYSFSPAKNFAIKLYAGSPKVSVLFDKPGLVVLGCNIHDSMVGFLAVVDTPYFGKSTAHGTLDLNVPKGRYRLRAWHEQEAQPFESKTITVEHDSLTVPVQLDMAAVPGISAPWPG